MLSVDRLPVSDETQDEALKMIDLYLSYSHNGVGLGL